MSEPHTSIIASLRQELAGTQKDNEELRRENAQQKDAINRANAQMVALTAENEQLRKERESLQQQLQEAKEQHETELREVTEEMAAAARFSDNEWREECRKARELAHKGFAAALELVPGAEGVARGRMREEEEAKRWQLWQQKKSATDLLPLRDAYRVVVAAAVPIEEKAEMTISDGVTAQLEWLCRALACSRGELDERFLGKEIDYESEGYLNTSAQARGLWELYLALCDVGFPSDATLRQLLSKEEIECLNFNAVGHEPEYDSHNYAIPTAAAYDFYYRVLRHLPKLKFLALSHLPPLSSPGALEALAGAPQRTLYLGLHHTNYTVDDLHTLRQRCIGLQGVDLHSSHCTDWGEYANVADLELRKAKVGEACGGIIKWPD